MDSGAKLQTGRAGPEEFPIPQSLRERGALSLPGRVEGGFPGFGHFTWNWRRSAGFVSRDKASGFQPRQDPAERLALDMDFCGKLFLVHGTGCNGFEGDDGGSRQAQGCERLSWRRWTSRAAVVSSR